MIRATFYCDIISPTGEILEEGFDFDSITCDTREEVDTYIKNEGYVEGESVGTWGGDEGILTEIVVEDMEV